MPSKIVSALAKIISPKLLLLDSAAIYPRLATGSKRFTSSVRFTSVYCVCLECLAMWTLLYNLILCNLAVSYCYWNSKLDLTSSAPQRHCSYYVALFCCSTCGIVHCHDGGNGYYRNPNDFWRSYPVQRIYVKRTGNPKRDPKYVQFDVNTAQNQRRLFNIINIT